MLLSGESKSQGRLKSLFGSVWGGEFQTICEPQFPCMHSGYSVIPEMPLTGARWEDGGPPVYEGVGGQEGLCQARQ